MESTIESTLRRPSRKRALAAWGGALSLVGALTFSVVAGASSVTSHAITNQGTTSVTFTGLTGEGTPNGPGTIEVDSWSWGASNQSTIGSGAGAGSGKVSMSSFNIMKRVDSTSPALFLACSQGTHFTTVTLTVSPPSSGTTPGDGFQVVLSNAFVSKYSVSSGGDYPTESVTLNFTKIEYKYSTSDGRLLRGGWDIKQNKKF
jgi:type VI secretion system secreted protein Hcp